MSPADGSGGGFVSPEKNETNEIVPEVGQTWISKDGETRIHIESLDPVLARKYGNERGVPDYKSVDELKKELKGYTLRLDKKKKSKGNKTNGSETHDPAITFYDTPHDETAEINPATGSGAEADNGTVPAAVIGDLETGDPVRVNTGAAKPTADTEQEDKPKLDQTPGVANIRKSSPEDEVAGEAKEADPKTAISVWESKEASVLAEPYKVFLGNFKLRVARRWITGQEIYRTNEVLNESEKMLNDILSQGLAPEVAEEKILEISETLPFVKMLAENKKGIEFFVSQEKEEGALMIENILVDARIKYTEEASKKDPTLIPKLVLSHWTSNVLPELEREVLGFMDAVVRAEKRREKERLNREALNDILLHCARRGKPIEKNKDRVEPTAEQEALLNDIGNDVVAFVRGFLKAAFDAREKGGEDTSITTGGGGEKDNDQSKEVADLLSRKGMIESPMMRVKMVDKEWEEFLARPQGKETAAMLQEMILDEWKKFDQNMYQEALARKAFVSKKERFRLWDAILLPHLREMVLEYLEQNHSIPRRSGGLIFKAMTRELANAAENKE